MILVSCHFDLHHTIERVDEFAPYMLMPRKDRVIRHEHCAQEEWSGQRVGERRLQGVLHMSPLQYMLSDNRYILFISPLYNLSVRRILQ